jgi:hypothetical protein
MFDITPSDIGDLSDVDLRELVGRLCEAELTSLGLSPSAVTWGGSQTAADGGLDVRVALPAGVSDAGFVPRPSTGFQVKKPDMPRARIIAEMRPGGAIRPAILELADQAGAYIIVSSSSTTDSALRNRRNALREALSGVANGAQLHTDFYDRTRLATWVRRHPGLIAWVKERLGRAILGWQPYGPWSGAAEGVDAEYLLDGKLRLHLGRHGKAPVRAVADAIDDLRDDLSQPGKIVRLVGLSGVGKTRLVQALFDARIGERPLPPSLAVYTNLSDNPDPQPTGLASDLIANRTQAVLIVDNCPPELHRRLGDLCSGKTSPVSVITVEYDVRDDQPEGTQVVSLNISSPDLVERLVRRRYPHLSEVDAHTIAEGSGGNARIAIALAETVERSESIAGLSNEELFQRLFRQRQEPNDALLLAAQACSLVYSFQGEALTGREAELPRLASLAGQVPTETYRHVGELLRRGLMQQRGVWRAVLPHAIANRLAARALEDIPYDVIGQHLVEGGTERLARSFSRRLSYLHDHPKAVAVVKKWLAPDGLLGELTTLNDLGRAMFENVAPVLPEAALAALERADGGNPAAAIGLWQRHLSLLRSLAYDPAVFERSVQLLARVSMQGTDEREAKQASETFVSLFTIHLSGTHATVEQRLGVVKGLLRSSEAKSQALGLAALDKVMEATHFSSGYRFEFGARSRDFGYQPRTHADVIQWYGAALTLIERLALDERVLTPELRNLVGRNFRGLWTLAHMHRELERLSRRFAADGFWREGWVACRQTMHFAENRLPPDVASRLSALEFYLRPANLLDQVRAVVLGDRTGWLDLEDVDIGGDPMSATERLEAIARELGALVAANAEAFAELLPDLLLGGYRAYSFGRGLAAASLDLRATWARLVTGLEMIAPERRDVQVLRGILVELWETDRDLAQDLLDEALDQPALVAFLPVLHSAVSLDDRGVDRLKSALSAGQVPVRMCRNLAFGQTTDDLGGGSLKDLVLVIAGQPEGFDVALEILFMRLHSDRSAQRKHEPELLEAGRELLRRVTFRGSNHREDYHLAGIVRAALIRSDSGPIAAAVAARLREAISAYETSASCNDDLVHALLEVQPTAALNAFLDEGSERDQRAGIRLFEDGGGHRANPVDAVPCETLITWCDGDSERRYPLAAAIITFGLRPEASGALVWSEHARALLANANEPRGVLTVLLKRFRPMGWSGSRAAVMEANARLLDSLEPLVPPALMSFVADAKTQLEQEIASERQRETAEDRERDERFE